MSVSSTNFLMSSSLELSATEQNLILQSAETYFAVLRAQDTLASTKAACAALANAMVPKEVAWSDAELMLLAYRQAAARERPAP